MPTKPVNGKENLEVKIFTQSYREAKESGIVSELEGIGVVNGYCDSNKQESPFSSRVIEIAHDMLKRNAEKIDGNYVFGIDYKLFDRDENLKTTFVYGDAYKRPSGGSGYDYDM